MFYEACAGIAHRRRRIGVLMVDELTMAGDHPEGDVEDVTRCNRNSKRLLSFLDKQRGLDRFRVVYT